MKNPQKKPQDTFDIVVIGEINADLILSGNVIPEFNQVEKIVDRADLVVGSSAVIFACGAAKLGLKTAVIGKVGADDFGQFMLNAMQDRGIDTSSICVDQNLGTGLSVILARENDRAILTYAGSIPELKYEDINFDLISRSQHLHLSGYFLLNKLRPQIGLLCERAKNLGATISLDTNYDPNECWDDGLQESLKFVDIFLPNEREAIAISGQDDLEQSLEWYTNKVNLVAVKQGEKGACLKLRDHPTIYQTAVSVEVVDTVGAGDSFDSGFIYGFLHNWPLKKTLKMSVACGSLSTLSAGGTAGQPSLSEALIFIKEYLE